MPNYSEMTEAELCKILATTKDRFVIECITGELARRRQIKEQQ